MCECLNMVINEGSYNKMSDSVIIGVQSQQYQGLLGIPNISLVGVRSGVRSDELLGQRKIRVKKLTVQKTLEAQNKESAELEILHIKSKKMMDKLYKIFEDILTDSSAIRFGTNEFISFKKLILLLNKRSNDYFNHLHERFMEKFSSERPELGILEKIKYQVKGYAGLAKVTDPPPKFREIPRSVITKYEKHVINREEDYNEFKIKLCDATGWSEREFIQLVNLNFFIHVSITDDIRGIVYVITGKIIGYMNTTIEGLNAKYQDSLDAKRKYQQAEDDKTLIEYEWYDIEIYNGHDLEKKIATYMGNAYPLPKVNYVTYPDIENMKLLVKWLRYASTQQACENAQLRCDHQSDDTKEFLAKTIKSNKIRRFNTEKERIDIEIKKCKIELKECENEIKAHEEKNTDTTLDTMINGIYNLFIVPQSV